MNEEFLKLASYGVALLSAVATWSERKRKGRIFTLLLVLGIFSLGAGLFLQFTDHTSGAVPNVIQHTQGNSSPAVSNVKGDVTITSPPAPSPDSQSQRRSRTRPKSNEHK